VNNNTNKKEQNFWRGLSNLWGIITALSFVISFFGIIDLSNALKSLTVIYIAVLSIYTGVKEINRWKSKNFISRYNGEIYILIWTIMMLAFIFLNVYNPERFHLSSEFTATYLSVLGIFAISQKSKTLKIKQ